MEIASVDALPAVALDVRALPSKDGALEIAILEDDTIDVGFLHTGVDVSRSVAKLQVPRHFNGVPSTLPGNKADIGFGTGWMIPPGLLITNFHVVNTCLPGKPHGIGSGPRPAGGAVVALFDFYHYDSAVHRAMSAGCIASDHRLEYAILCLTGDSSPRPTLRLRTSPILTAARPGAPGTGERAAAPWRRPDASAIPQQLRRDRYPDQRSYFTNTAGGSSGSPICYDTWFVAALHRGFRNSDQVGRCSWTGPCLGGVGTPLIALS